MTPPNHSPPKGTKIKRNTERSLFPGMVRNAMGAIIDTHSITSRHFKYFKKKLVLSMVMRCWLVSKGNL